MVATEHERKFARKLHGYVGELHRRLCVVESYLTGEDAAKYVPASTSDIVEEVMDELRLCIERAERIEEIVKKIK